MMKPDRVLQHCFPIREDMSAIFTLPRDVTHMEVKSLIKFLESLVIEKK